MVCWRWGRKRVFSRFVIGYIEEFRVIVLVDGFGDRFLIFVRVVGGWGFMSEGGKI